MRGPASNVGRALKKRRAHFSRVPSKVDRPPARKNFCLPPTPTNKKSTIFVRDGPENGTFLGPMAHFLGIKFETWAGPTFESGGSGG